MVTRGSEVKIAAPQPVLGQDAVRHPPRLGQHRLREDVGEALGVGHAQHLDARLAGAANHLDHLPRQGAGAGGERHLHHVAVTSQAGVGDRDLPAEGEVVGHHPGAAPLGAVGADEEPPAPLHHLEEPAGRAAAAPGHDLHAHHVAVERAGGLAGRQEDVLALSIDRATKPKPSRCRVSVPSTPALRAPAGRLADLPGWSAAPPSVAAGLARP